MDVTEEYENAMDLEYKFKHVVSNTGYAYLCVFNNLAWNEVAWGKMRGGKVVFDKIGKDIVYMPCYYDGNKPIFADYPLWVKSDGEVEPLVADKNVLQKLRLKRKYSYNTAGDYYGNAIIGVELEGTNDLSKIRLQTLDQTRNCPLARFVRKRLKRRGCRLDKIVCVSSDEAVSVPESALFMEDKPSDGGRRRHTMGSLPTVTAVFGLTIANEAILRLSGYKSR